MKVNVLNVYKMMRTSAAKEALFSILKQKGLHHRTDTFYGLNCKEGQKHSCAHTLEQQCNTAALTAALLW